MKDKLELVIALYRTNSNMIIQKTAIALGVVAGVVATGFVLAANLNLDEEPGIIDPVIVS